MKSAIESGIITTETIAELQEQVEMNNRNKYLAKHTNKIYQGKDGRWFTKVPVVEGGVITKKRHKAFHSQKEAEDYVISIYRMLESDPTVKEIFTKVMDDKINNEEIVPSTFSRNWIDFRRYFGEFGKRRISTIEEYDIEDFLIEQKRKYKLTAKSYGNLTTIVRAIFRYARRKKMISYNIDEVVKYVDIGRNSFRKIEHEEYDEVFTDEEIAKLIDYISKDLDNPYYLGLLLLFGTGLRVGELSSLKWDDYNGKSISINKTETTYMDRDGVYHCEVSNRPKTDAGRRRVPIPSSMTWIFDKMKELNPDDEYIFMTYYPAKRKMVRCRSDYFRKQLIILCEKAGVPRKPPHKIRKTYASILLDHGMSDKTITENMGHTDLSVTRQCYSKQRLTDDQRQRIIDEIDEFKTAKIV